MDVHATSADFHCVDPHPETTKEYEELLAKLPPMRAPDLCSRRFQGFTGCSILSAASAVCIALIRIGAAKFPDDWDPLASAFCHLASAEALLALACYVGVIFVDCPVLERSPENCSPIPWTVVSVLIKGEPLGSLRKNLVVEGRTYCVRCFVWRGAPSERIEQDSNLVLPTRSRIHHCLTCRRCVKHFDHHCGILGRCIAGTGVQGNLVWYKLLLGMGYVGIFTALVSLTLGYLQEYMYVMAAVFVIFAAVTFSMTYGTSWRTIVALEVQNLIPACLQHRFIRFLPKKKAANS